MDTPGAIANQVGTGHISVHQEPEMPETQHDNGKPIDLGDFVFTQNLPEMTRENAGQYVKFPFVGWLKDPCYAVDGDTDRQLLYARMAKAYAKFTWTIRAYD